MSMERWRGSRTAGVVILLTLAGLFAVDYDSAAVFALGLIPPLVLVLVLPGIIRSLDKLLRRALEEDLGDEAPSSPSGRPVSVHGAQKLTAAGG